MIVVLTLLLLQIAQRNGLDVDVNLALSFASHYVKIGTMEFLIEGGHADTFFGPLMQAAERTMETAAAVPELRAFMTEHWSEAAFVEGVRLGEDHYVNFMRVLLR